MSPLPAATMTRSDSAAYFSRSARPGSLVFDLAAALFEFLHPAGKLDALIDGLRGLVEQAVPFDGLVAGAIWRGNDQADRVDSRAFLVPEIQAQLPLVAQCDVEHALARHDFPGADVVARAVLHEANVIASRQQAVAKLQARLAAADNRNHSFRHFALPSISGEFVAVPLFIPSAVVLPDRRVPVPWRCSRRRRGCRYR